LVIAILSWAAISFGVRGCPGSSLRETGRTFSARAKQNFACCRTAACSLSDLGKGNLPVQIVNAHPSPVRNWARRFFISKNDNWSQEIRTNGSFHLLRFEQYISL